MSPLTTGVLYGAATLAVMFSGVPTAFALGIVAVAFMCFFMPAAALDIVAQNVCRERVKMSGICSTSHVRF